MAEVEKESINEDEAKELEGKSKKTRVPVRLILIYILLLSAGLFIGILVAYLFR